MLENDKNKTNIFRGIGKEIFEKSEEDIRKRVYLTPQKIIWETKEEQCYIENSEALLEERSPQISLVANHPCTMHSGRKPAAVLLDFGCEIHGGIAILVWNAGRKQEAKLRVRFGESAMEAISEIGDGTNATNDHANRDMTITVGSMSMNPVGETGFRFVRIDLLEEDTHLELKTVKGILLYKDIEYQGSFECSDELLNRIWDTGAYTVHLNMQNYIWDGIKRDRLVWVGDMHPEVMTIQTVFGFDDCVPKSLDFVKEETPLPGWMNQFPAYSMWWIMIQHDWFMHNGNLDYLKAQRTYLLGLREQLSAAIDSNGKDITPETRFIDWPSLANTDVVDAGLQALHMLATIKMKKIFEILGEQEAAKACSLDIKLLKQYHADAGTSKQAGALLVMAGLQDAKTANEELLGMGGAKGMSTFMGYYILTARAMAGDMKGCLDCIREYWGGMLELGATTFWEDFDVAWMKDAAPLDEVLTDTGKVNVHGTYGGYCYQGYRHSLCHGWAAGATPWLTENILGIQILESGCRKVRINPVLGDLKWAKGSYPTPFGVISVFVSETKNNGVEVKIQAPPEIEIVRG